MWHQKSNLLLPASGLLLFQQGGVYSAQLMQEADILSDTVTKATSQAVRQDLKQSGKKCRG